jgi:hypothetical protein
VSSNIPRLAPFWYTPEGQEETAEKISFHLRPLSQPQMVDIEEHYVGGRQTKKAQFIAGTMGVIGVKGIRNPETGARPIIPECFDWIPRAWVRLAGMRLIAEDQGIDWDKLMEGLDPSEAEGPQDDPLGN